MDNLKQRGRSRKKNQNRFLDRLIRGNRRKLSALLCASMVLNGTVTTFPVMAAEAEKDTVSRITLESSELWDALDDAVEKDSKAVSPEFSGKHREAFEDIFDNNLDLYKLSSAGVTNINGLNVEIYAKVSPESLEAKDSYDEDSVEFVFLVSNGSETEEKSVQIVIDGKASRTVGVAAKSDVEDGEEGAGQLYVPAEPSTEAPAESVQDPVGEAGEGQTGTEETPAEETKPEESLPADSSEETAGSEEGTLPADETTEAPAEVPEQGEGEAASDDETEAEVPETPAADDGSDESQAPEEVPGAGDPVEDGSDVQPGTGDEGSVTTPDSSDEGQQEDSQPAEDSAPAEDSQQNGDSSAEPAGDSAPAADDSQSGSAETSDNSGEGVTVAALSVSVHNAPYLAVSGDPLATDAESDDQTETLSTDDTAEENTLGGQWTVDTALMDGKAVAAYVVSGSELKQEQIVNAITVEVDSDSREEGIYNTIQAAIDYIVAEQAKEGYDDSTEWVVEVAAGEYNRFLVPHGVSNITIQGQGDATVITTLNDSELDVEKSEKHNSDGQGIIVWGADITLKNLKIVSGEDTAGVWYASAVGTQDGMWGSSDEAYTSLNLVDCTFEGSGSGYAIMPQRGAFRVEGCDISNYEQAIYFACDNYYTAECQIINNTISDCIYAIHGYYGTGSDETQPMVIRDNVISGKSDRFAVVAVLDQSNTGAVKLDIADNEFHYTIVGGINQRKDGDVVQGTMEEVQYANTLEDYSFVVDAYWYAADDYGTTFYAPKYDGKIATWYSDPTQVGDADEETVQKIIEALNEYGTAGQVIELDSSMQEAFTLVKNAIVIEDYVDAGDLKIEKIVEGNDNDTTDFTFTVKLFREKGTDGEPDTVLNGRYEYTDAEGNTHQVKLVDGQFQVTMKAGESITVQDLLPGTIYEVTEEPSVAYVSEGTNTTGSIVANETQTVTYVNTYDPSGLPEIPDTEWEKSKSKTATQLDENYESDVTLSLPAYDYKASVDVVMVIDVSSSMKDADIAEAKAAAIAMCDELASKSEIDAKVGIVTFDKEAHNKTEGLVSLDEAKSAINQISASEDTNMMAGLMAGKDMLDQGTATDKYLVVMSDGIPIYWVDENGEVVSKTLEKYEKDKETLISTGPAGTEPEGSASDDFSTMLSMSQLLGIKDWASDSDVWKQVSDTGEIINSDEYKYTNIQKATYMTARYLMEEILGRYQVKMIAFGTDKYENNVVYKYGENFCDWIGSQNGVSYYKVAKPGYGGSEGDLVQAFEDIANEMIHVVDAGSQVVDEIGNTTEYNFDFINQIDRLTLTVDGTKLEAVQIDDTTYGFGRDGEGYQFVLHYYPQGIAFKGNNYGECFVWDINIPITIDMKVSLTYGVKLMNPQTAEGTYGQYDADGSKGYDGLYTNNVATLYPVDSNGQEYQPENFPKPTVSYTVDNGGDTPVDPTPGGDTPVDPAPGGSSGGGSSSGSGSSGGGAYTPSGGPGVTINPEEVPLAPLPDTSTTTTIGENEVPLSPLPKTGETARRGWAVMMLSGALMALAAVLSRKREEER